MGEVEPAPGTRRRRALRPPSARSTALVCALVPVACVAIGALVLHMFAAGRHVGQVAGTGRALAAALFLAGGVLRVARWRIAGDTRSGLMGAGLLVVGGLLFPLADVAAALTSTQADSLLVAFLRGVPTLVVLTLVAMALAGHEPGEALPVRPLLVAAAACTGLGGLLVGLAELWLPVALTGDELARALLSVVLAAGWATAGIGAGLRSAAYPWAGRVAPLLLAMGVAELLRGLAPHDSAVGAIAAAVSVTVAVLAAYGALVDLVEASAAQDEHLESFARALTQAHAVVSDQTAWREGMVHDAHNAIAGLRAAMLVLSRHDGPADPAVDNLRSAAFDELGHLEHLIARCDEADTVDYRLDSVVRRAVETRSALGMTAELITFPCWSHGRPADVTTALQNLLVNAQRHGGGEVTVRVDPLGDRVRVTVADRGPGLPGGDVAVLFERGIRGPDSSGSGLGLHLARTLARNQGGQLVARPREGGGAEFVLTLPLAGCAPVVPLPRRTELVPGTSGPAR